MKIVSPYKTSLDPSNAYWMARISWQIYSRISDTDNFPDEQNILTNLKDEDDKFISVTGFDNNSAQAALIEHEDYLCMTFRGTNEIVDWLDNVNAFSTSELFGKFHRGFWNSVQDVWEPLDTHFRQLQNHNKRPLFITGHSLGGAMATIAAARFIHEDKPFTSVYTFGQPRVMTRNTSRIFNAECRSRYFRFHNNNDIVTRVPSRLMGYSHIGSYLYITNEGEINQEVGFWSRFLDYYDGAADAVKESGIDAVEDHNMGKYLQAVKNWNLSD